MRNHDGQNNGGPFFVTSPLNKSKQESFNNTGKINPQADNGNMMDEPIA
jgi:hypothetical protein